MKNDHEVKSTLIIFETIKFKGFGKKNWGVLGNFKNNWIVFKISVFIFFNILKNIVYKKFYDRTI
jgi:hypothetical protein